ncbi:MAG: diacylglycerol kinase family protein [Burkholderiaceae bacterium]
MRAEAPLVFIINGASGSADGEAKRRAIEAVLNETGRRGELRLCAANMLTFSAREAAAQVREQGGAVVAVGGDGTLNTVAQAAHAEGCAMGVVPQGTFNYFARTHGIPAESDAAVRLLLTAQPVPVQVAAVNDRLFLVNASLGLYPDLLQDREAYKARFGRNRFVAFSAGCATLLRAQRRLRLSIDHGGRVREVKTLTLFIGNNRLQLAQLGVDTAAQTRAVGEGGHLTAVMLRPIGTLGMLRLMLRGAVGSLGEADSIERFEFDRIRVKPSRVQSGRGVKVAFDGEVAWMQPPLEFKVHERPLFLLKAAPSAVVNGIDRGAASE